jgi:hypothetical protein
MSCPLDKLAPETRTVIYEYVLSFDTPLKHVTKMQPFVKKLTGIEPKSGSGSTGSETETITDLQRVNTSLLTASKLIYVEAIAVFYKHNTIHFDAQMCKFEDLDSPRATDLSLAKHVIVKIDDSVDPKASRRIGSAAKMSGTTVPVIFPNMCTCSVYISVDTNPNPSTLLVSLCCSLLGDDMFSEVYFNGIGSLHAVMRGSPCLKLVMQSKWTMDRWANLESISPGSLTLTNISAPSLYQASRANHQNIFGQHAKFVFNMFKTLLEEPELENVEPDGYEFWTSVDACLCAARQLYP